MPQLPSRQYAAALAALSICGLSACAGSSDQYPSLAIRDVERVPAETYRIDSGPPIAVRSAPDAQTLARVRQLRGALANAHADFMRSVPAARRSVAAARGSAIGSDRWASAQIALADLDSARSLAAVPLADLDAVYTEAAIAFVETSQIADIRGSALNSIREEDRILASLRAAVRP